MPSKDELEAQYQRDLQRRSAHLENLRARAGLSMDELAKAMGFRGQSSIQRYLTPEYDKGFRIELIGKFAKALIGRGDPPITNDDLMPIVRWRTPKAGDLGYDLKEIFGEWHNKAEPLNAVVEGNRIRVVLPLPEGHAVMEIPDLLSEKSFQTLKSWSALVIDLAEVGSKASERIDLATAEKRHKMRK